MNPSYFRIRLPLPEAKQRLAGWLDIPSLGALVATSSLDAVRLACTPAGYWRGTALFLYENAGWSVFEDVTGEFAAQGASRWLLLARTDELVFAGYNDATLWGELVVIREGTLLRAFSHSAGEPDTNVDVGSLPWEAASPLRTWLDVASFVDDDLLFGKESGWLWVRESRDPSH